MKSKIIAKVILISSGEVHIALATYKSVFASANGLISLFSNPYAFIQKNCNNFSDSTRYIFPQRKELDNLDGLTLAAVFDDTRIEIYFPVICEYFSVHNDEYINLSKLEFKNTFSDQQEYFIKLFLELSKKPFSEINFDRKIPINNDRQEYILREILNSSLDCFKVHAVDIASTENNSDDNSTDWIFTNNEVSASKMVSTNDYSIITGHSVETVRSWIYNNKLRTATKIKGKWFVDSLEPPPKDRRAGRKVKPKTEKYQKNVRLQGTDYTSVQEYIKDRKIVTDNIRKYIRSYEEIKYYEKHNYHEVEWDGKPALIIDINPDYFVESIGKTNRQIIIDGGSPVVPENNDFVYDIHHVGQCVDSPFAILPSNIHNGKGTSSIFHQGSQNKELHNKTFEAEKRAFWLNYLKYYDRYGSFAKIPFLNSKHKKDQR